MKMLKIVYFQTLRVLVEIIVFIPRMWGQSTESKDTFHSTWDQNLSWRQRQACDYYTEIIKAQVEKEKVIRLGGKGEYKLSEIYVPVRLHHISNDTDDNALTIYQAIEQTTDPMLITGEPGIGKSILARYLINRVLFPTDVQLDPNLSDIGHRRADIWFPIFVSLDNIQVVNALEREIDLTQGLKTWLASIMFLDFFKPGLLKRVIKSVIVFIATNLLKMNLPAESSPQKKAKQLLDRILQSGQALIVFDGLEHVFKNKKSSTTSLGFIHALDTLAQQCVSSGNILLVTTRPGEAEHFYNWSHFTLLSPTPTQSTISDFLQKRMATNDQTQAEEFAQMIDDANEQVRTLTRNPLLLTMLALFLKNVRRASETYLKQPIRRAYLYEKCLGQLWSNDRGQYDDEIPLQWKHVKDILGRLAYEMLEQGQIYCSVSDLENHIEQVGKETEELKINIEDERREIVDQAELLYPIDFKTLLHKISWWERVGLFLKRRQVEPFIENRLSFLHFTFQEYFAYEHLKKRHTNSFEQVKMMLTDSQWREVIAMNLTNKKQTPSIILDIIQHSEEQPEPE